MGHRVCGWLRLHRGHDGIHIGNVHHQPDSGWIFRIDECPDVGDSEGPEEPLTLRGSEPVILVLLGIRPSRAAETTAPWAVFANVP